MSKKEKLESENSGPEQTWDIRLACNEEEQSQSLALMIQENDPDVKRQEVEKILKLHQDGKLDLNKMLIASSQGKVRAALLMVIQQDQTAILWPPVCDHEIENSDIEESLQGLLLEEALSLAQKESCEAVQMTVDCNDLQTSELLSKNGIPFVGTMLFLQRPASLGDDQGKEYLTDGEENPCQQGIVRLVPIAQEMDDETLGELVLKTYVGSADFPELQHQRTGARSLLTHRLQGEYDPAHWFVIEQDGVRVGILFFSYHCDLDQWELTYLGILPEHRGKGIARRAIWNSFEQPLRKDQGIFLGVDDRNSYAIRLYETLGFVAVSRQFVHFCSLQKEK